MNSQPRRDLTTVTATIPGNVAVSIPTSSQVSCGPARAYVIWMSAAIRTMKTNVA